MKKRFTKKVIAAALAGMMLVSSAVPTGAWTLTDEVSAREEYSAEISLEAAGEGMVLLENNGTLPVAKGSKIALYGNGAICTIKGGTGSGDVNQRKVINLYDGMSEYYEIVNMDYLQPYINDWALAQAGQLTASTDYINQLSYIVNGIDVGTLSTENRNLVLGTWQYPDEDSFVYTDAAGNVVRDGGNTLGFVALYTTGTVWSSTPNYYNTLLIPGTDLSDGPAGARITKTGTKTLWQLVSGIEVVQDEDGEYYVSKEAEFNVLEDTTFYQFATAFPVGVTLAQTWNEELMERVGQCYGDEYVEFEMTYILEPGMNIHRTPLCGRNFEYYSEDPVITGYTAAAFTRGMQSKDGIGATLKHFAGNNNETYRNYVNDVVSERALREIYLKGFEIAVKNAEPMAIMTSYNLINGERTVNSYDLCTDICKEEWGYDGVIMSDYGAANRATANEELGLNMWANIMHSGNDWIMGGSGNSITGDASFLTVLNVDGEEAPQMALGDLQDSAITILNSIMKTNMFGDKMADYVDTAYVSAEEIAGLKAVHNGSYTALFDDLKTYSTVAKSAEAPEVDPDIPVEPEEFAITKQPVDVAAGKGKDAIVTVEATGEGLTYEWYYKNPDNVKFYKSGDSFINGGTYSIPMYSWRDGQQVYCVITDANGDSVQTNTVTLR